MIHLELPNTKYKKSYIEAVKEFEKKGSDNESTDHYLKKSSSELEAHFDSFVETLLNNSKGKDLPEGWVASTQYWLIDEDENYCGRVTLRHKLTENLKLFGGHIGYDIIPSQRRKGYSTKALELCLKEAKKREINELVITCDDKNIASARTIENNGGILRDTYKYNGMLIRRYDIKL